MKISVQEKIAELERRIMALEGAQKRTVSTTVTTTSGVSPETIYLTHGHDPA